MKISDSAAPWTGTSSYQWSYKTYYIYFECCFQQLLLSLLQMLCVSICNNLSFKVSFTESIVIYLIPWKFIYLSIKWHDQVRWCLSSFLLECSVFPYSLFNVSVWAFVGFWLPRNNPTPGANFCIVKNFLNCKWQQIQLKLVQGERGRGNALAHVSEKPRNSSGFKGLNDAKGSVWL